MRLKEGVRVAGVRPEIVLAMQVAEVVYQEHQSELVITSVTEGTHSPTSLHYSGAAFDCRIWNVNPRAVRDSLADRLGEDYDVVLERTHLHVEFQPKSGL